MKCQKCGAEIAYGSTFCEYCGTKSGKNEQASECTVHVRWLLLLAMVLVSAANLGFMEYLWDEVVFKNDWEWEGWLSIPILSFIICIPSLVLYIKKKISLVFTSLMFGVFALNVVLVAKVGDMESDYETGYHIVFYKGDEIVKEEDFIAFDEYCDCNNVTDKIISALTCTDCCTKYISVTNDELTKHIEDVKFSFKFGEKDREPYCYEEQFYSGFTLEKLKVVVSLILFLEVLLGILYLIYAYIAHKRGCKY